MNIPTLLKRFSAALPAILALALAGCTAMQTAGRGEFHSPAWRPQNPDDVKVYVSEEAMAVYVMEGDRPLLVTPVSVGRAESPTPKGNFTIYHKDADRRNRTYGMWIKGNHVVGGRSSQSPGAGYKFYGYPMAYWCEFKSAYGFHEGSVWPQPRSKGCIRVHPNVAPKFFALVKHGTPVSIRRTQPFDATYGRDLERPQDYADPDRPVHVLISDEAYRTPPHPLFEDDKPARSRQKI
jgi:hypothetical protein